MYLTHVHEYSCIHVCNYNHTVLYFWEDLSVRCFREDSLGETLLHTCICISSNQCANIYEKIRVCSPSHYEQHGKRICQHPKREIVFTYWSGLWNSDIIHMSITEVMYNSQRYIKYSASRESTSYRLSIGWNIHFGGSWNIWGESRRGGEGLLNQVIEP